MAFLLTGCSYSLLLKQNADSYVTSCGSDDTSIALWCHILCLCVQIFDAGSRVIVWLVVSDWIKWEGWESRHNKKQRSCSYILPVNQNNENWKRTNLYIDFSKILKAGYCPFYETETYPKEKNTSNWRQFFFEKAEQASKVHDLNFLSFEGKIIAQKFRLKLEYAQLIQAGLV